MHPPWITFDFLLLRATPVPVKKKAVLSTTSTVSNSQNESDNSTVVSRQQREAYERERRLIPYMTYYVTQNLASPNSGVGQNIFVPVTSPRENIFQVNAVPKIPLANIQNINPQTIEILPKSVVRLTSPPFIAPTTQAGYYKSKDIGIYPQIYRLESGMIRPRIQPQSIQQIQSESQPLQVTKQNPAPTEQKYASPQLVKIIPVITKLPLENRSPTPVNPSQPNFLYARGKFHAVAPEQITANEHYYYKEPLPSQNKNSYQENKVYESRDNPQVRVIAPDANKYTIAKIVVSTTPLPYINDGRSEQVSVAHLNHINPDYGREQVISTVPPYTHVQQHLPYVQKTNVQIQQQDLIQRSERLPKLRVPEEEKIRFVAQVPVTNDLEGLQWKVNTEAQEEKVNEKDSFNNILALLKETNKLPQNLTPDNIDAGIKTLALILERLQQQKNYHDAQKIAVSTSGVTTPASPIVTIKQEHHHPKKVHSFPEKSGTSTPGRPGIDYPTYSSIPQTNFDCSTQRYKGFFGDPDTNCQVWHYCDLNGGQASFLCPNGTIFSQVALTCDWWFNVKCASTSQLYVLNERLYKYILPFTPSFPEDYSGPVVDTYLAAKFKEMEAKSKLKALKSLANSTTTEKPVMTTEEQTDASTESFEEYQTQSSEV